MSSKKEEPVCPVGFGGPGVTRNPVETLSGPKKTSCDSTEIKPQTPSQKGATNGEWNLESGQHYTVDNVAPTEGLSTKALKSSIPKGGSEKEETWTYPSPQRFYNAMRKKGWEANPEDISTVVAIHNTVNERSWSEVMKYEKILHCDECSQPKLLKFRGRPTEYSPKARFFNLFGYSLPFDRHDWVVDRCGKQVRYIIDFYQGPVAPNSQQQTAIYLDVRPSLTLGGFWDRMKMKYFEVFQAEKLKTQTPSSQ